MKFGKSRDFQNIVVKGDILCVYYNFGTHSQVQYHHVIFDRFADCAYAGGDACEGCLGKIVITLPVAQTQRRICGRSDGDIRISIVSQLLPEELFEI